MPEPACIAANDFLIYMAFGFSVRIFEVRNLVYFEVIHHKMSLLQYLKNLCS